MFCFIGERKTPCPFFLKDIIMKALCMQKILNNCKEGRLKGGRERIQLPAKSGVTAEDEAGKGC